MKIRISQPAVNAMRAVMNGEGWTKDFEDFYAAGKALYEWPKTKMLMGDATQADVDELMKTQVEFDIDDPALKVFKKAFKHFVEAKKPATEHHFEILLALGLDPKTSLS